MDDVEWTHCANCGKLLQEGQAYYCDGQCKADFELGVKTIAQKYVSDDSIWNGVWEHIAPEPINITGGRKELIKVCKAHGVMPRALLKPKSRGRGYEMQGDNGSD